MQYGDISVILIFYGFYICQFEHLQKFIYIPKSILKAFSWSFTDMHGNADSGK